MHEKDSEGPERPDRPFLFKWRGAIPASELTSTQKLVAWTLSHHMDRAGGSCWPSIPLLAREASLAESTVRDALLELDAKGFIGRKPGRGRGNSTRYQATIPEAENRRPSAVLAEHENRRPAVVKPPTPPLKPPTVGGKVVRKKSKRTPPPSRVRAKRTTPTAADLPLSPKGRRTASLRRSALSRRRSVSATSGPRRSRSPRKGSGASSQSPRRKATGRRRS